jgi:hypothetical protein
VATSDETQANAVKADRGDSKDFVEHLRTVHFTLVTVCLALIVILQFPSPVSIREAIHQLNTIVDATHVWKDTWIDEGVPRELSNVGGVSSCVNPVTSDFATVASGMQVSLHFQNVNWTLRTSNPMPINSQYMTDAKYTTVRHTTIDAPKRLDEFKNIWNNSYSILCPIHISDEGVNVLFSAKETIVPIKRESVSSAVRPSPAMLMDNGAARKFSGLHKGQSVESEGLFYSAGFLPIANPNTSVIGMSNNPMMLDIPVLDSKVFPFDYRGVLIKEVPQYNWLHSEFKEAFYELDQATTGFQDLDFDHIKQILQQNEKNSKEAFQAFGVTFPIETTARWGTLIIIVIQFYFLLHLVEYGKKESLDKPDVAWIGIYASPGARLLFCATALILPLAVIIFVCIKDSFLPNMPIRNALLRFAAVSVSAVLSFYAAKQYFKKEVPPPKSPMAAT